MSKIKRLSIVHAYIYRPERRTGLSFLYVVTGEEDTVTGFPIGLWDFPSGNRIAVSLEAGNGVRRLRCAWHWFPPSRKDRQYYRETVAPEIYQRVQEYLEIPADKMMVVGVEDP